MHGVKGKKSNQDQSCISGWQCRKSETTTHKFLMAPDSSRDLKRLIQTITNQFLCHLPTLSWDSTLTFLCGLSETNHLRSDREFGPHPMLVPRTGTAENRAHHCIWQEVISLIGKYSTEKPEDRSTAAAGMVHQTRACSFTGKEGGDQQEGRRRKRRRTSSK